MSMLLPGLKGTQYTGYFNEDPNWFQTAEPTKEEVKLNWMNALSGENGYSWQFLGTFVPQYAGFYAFTGSADDAMILWIGSNAEEGNFTTENFFVSGNASYFTTEERMFLSAGVSYPIRIQWGHPEEPTASGFSIEYNHIDDNENFYGSYSDWSNVTFHEVPYTINIVRQPTTQVGARGELLFFSCSAVATNNEPVSYNWILSGADFWMGQNILNIDQFLNFSLNDTGVTNPALQNQSIQRFQNNFKADTKVLTLRNTDATIIQGLPLSSFSFICVPFLSSEPAPFRLQFSGSSQTDYVDLLNVYPHTNPVNAVIDSFPEYPHASPYYLLRAGEVVSLSSIGEEGEFVTSLTQDVVSFPGLISFIASADGGQTLLYTNDPNDLENVVVLIGINSAEGHIHGNKSEYLSSLTELTAGIISFIQNENTATYSFGAESFSLIYDGSGPMEDTYVGAYQCLPGALTLISPSSSPSSSGLFNSYDPITIRIESDEVVTTQDDGSVFGRHAYGSESGRTRYLRLRNLGYV